jgi:hypothetical protein
MNRRTLLFAPIAALFAPLTAFAKRRKRKPTPKPKGGFANEVERRQVLQSFQTDRLQVALDVTFLLRAWTVEELDAELQRRQGSPRG